MSILGPTGAHFAGFSLEDPLGIEFAPLLNDQGETVLVHDDRTVRLMDHQIVPDLTAGRRNVMMIPKGFPDHLVMPEVLDNEHGRELTPAAMTLATKMRDAIFAHAAQQGQQPQPLLLKLWIGGDGIISRLDVPPLGDDQADYNLRVVMLGHHLAPPPKGMLQPLRLMVQLQAPKIGDKKAAAPTP